MRRELLLEQLFRFGAGQAIQNQINIGSGADASSALFTRGHYIRLRHRPSVGGTKSFTDDGRRARRAPAQGGRPGGARCPGLVTAGEEITVDYGPWYAYHQHGFDRHGFSADPVT